MTEMHPKETIQLYVERYGIEALNNHVRLISWCKDLCPSETRFLSCLSIVAESGVLRPLIRSSGLSDNEKQLIATNVYNQIVENIGLSETVAMDMVLTLAYGVGWSAVELHPGSTPDDSGVDTNCSSDDTFELDQSKIGYTDAEKRKLEIEIKKHQVTLLKEELQELKRRKPRPSFIGNHWLILAFVVCISVWITTVIGVVSGEESLGRAFLMIISLIGGYVFFAWLIDGAFGFDGAGCFLSVFLYGLVIPWFVVLYVYIKNHIIPADVNEATAIEECCKKIDEQIRKLNREIAQLEKHNENDFN